MELNDKTSFFLIVAIMIVGMIIFELWQWRNRKKARKEDEAELEKLNNGDFPWSKDSIRQKYLVSQHTGKVSLSRIFEFGQFICPICLKTIVIDDLRFTCPYCDRKYGYDNLFGEHKESGAIGSIEKIVMTGMEKIAFREALFNACVCDGKIKDIKCYHNQCTIDLFAPYNEKELEMKRYV